MLFLRFGLHLEDSSLPEWYRPKGLWFHRWLPDGKADAVRFSTADKRNWIELWLERTGYVDHAFIRHDPKRKEVDLELMPKQGKLEASPLIGEAFFVHVMKPEIEAVRAGSKGSAHYVTLGRRVLDFVTPPLITFIDLIRTQYGQYWIREIRPWDSRRESVGSYCRSLSMRWRESPEEEWKDFVPDHPSQLLAGAVPKFTELLSESDWRTIQSICKQSEARPSLPILVAGRAHELEDHGNVSEAFVQAVTAVELASEDYLKARVSESSEKALVLADQFLNLPLNTRIAILATVGKLLAPATLDDALRGIALRNEIVHEGKRPKESSRDLFRALIDCVRAFTGVPALKTPAVTTTNSISDPPGKQN